MRRRALMASQVGEGGGGELNDWSIDVTYTINLEYMDVGSTTTAPWDLPDIYTLASRMCKTIGLKAGNEYWVNDVPSEFRVLLNNTSPYCVIARFSNQDEFEYVQLEYWIGNMCLVWKLGVGYIEIKRLV